MIRTSVWLNSVRAAQLFLGIMAAHSAYAANEIFKYTDSNGNVHYSSQPFDDTSTKIELKKNDQTGEGITIPRLKPIPYKGKGASRLVLITKPSIAMDPSKNNQAVAKLTAGPRCILPINITLAELVRMKESFYVDSYDYAIRGVMDKRNYYTKVMGRYTDADEDSVLLKAEFLNFDVNVCAPGLDPADIAARKSSSFAIADTKSKLYSKIRWSLSSQESGDVLFSTVTEVSVDNRESIDQYQSVHRGFSLMLEIATDNLLADDKFTNLLFRKKSTDGVQSGNKAVVNNESIGNKIANAVSGGYYQASKLTGSIHIVSAIKTKISVYHQMNGVMPDTLDDLDLYFSKDILAGYDINEIYLSGGGVIMIKLISEYGSNAYMKYSPVMESAGSMSILNWTCTSNINRNVSALLACASK